MEEVIGRIKLPTKSHRGIYSAPLIKVKISEQTGADNPVLRQLCVCHCINGF
jgi:hypothetical protein